MWRPSRLNSGVTINININIYIFFKSCKKIKKNTSMTTKHRLQTITNKRVQIDICEKSPSVHL